MFCVRIVANKSDCVVGTEVSRGTHRHMYAAKEGSLGVTFEPHPSFLSSCSHRTDQNTVCSTKTPRIFVRSFSPLTALLPLTVCDSLICFVQGKNQASIRYSSTDSWNYHVIWSCVSIAKGNCIPSERDCVASGTLLHRHTLCNPFPGSWIH